MPIAPSGQFKLVLSNVLRGEEVLKDPCCEFSYHWDFEKNMGLATLVSMNGTPMNITLHPLGIQGRLDFMSDIPPTKYTVNAECDNSVALIEVVVYRVILDMNPETGEKEAAIMFKMDGSTIQTTANFSEASASKSLPEVEHE